MQGSHLGYLHSLAAACPAVSLLLPSGCKVPGAHGHPTLGTMCFLTAHSRLVLEWECTLGCPLGSSFARYLPGTVGSSTAGRALGCAISHTPCKGEWEHTLPGERIQKLPEDSDWAGACAHSCVFLGCSPAVSGPSTSYLPQCPFFLEHSHHHAHGNHQAGEHSHEDAQDLCPGGEAVVAILRRLVLDNVIHQQSLWDGKKVRSSQRSHAQKRPGDDGTSHQKDGLCGRRCQQSSLSHREVTQGCWHHHGFPAPSSSSS